MKLEQANWGLPQKYQGQDLFPSNGVQSDEQSNMADRPRTAVSWPGSDKFYNPYIGKGLVLFTGPDGIRDHDVTVIDPTCVGIGTMSPEGTSDLNYLWRASKSCPHPLQKHCRVGEIGWGIRYYRDLKNIGSGHQIERREFRQECEDRHTHLYQNPWYPGPNDKQLTQQNLGNYDSQAGRPHTTSGSSRQGLGSGRLARSKTTTPTRSPHYYEPAARPLSGQSRSGTHHSSSTSVHSQQLGHQIDVLSTFDNSS